MKLRVSEAGVIFFRDGKLIWDDYFEHRQLALSSLANPLLNWFKSWRDIESIEILAAEGVASQEDLRQTVRQLVEVGILIRESSPEHERELRLGAWDGWGTAAKYFHFASRTQSWTAFTTGPEDVSRLKAKAQEEPPPPISKHYETADRVILERPSGFGQDLPWSFENREFFASGSRDGTTFIDTLLRRRSVRCFDTTVPMSRFDLSTLLWLVAGSSQEMQTTLSGPLVLRTSPSGGARHPIEVYPYIRNVEGIDPGLYHYSGEQHALERLDGEIPRERFIATCGDQDYSGDAAVVCFYAADLGRLRWKYDTGRAYRVLLLDLGHLSQTFYLVSTWLRLGTVFSAAMRDEMVEQSLRLDPMSEVPLGLSAVGVPAFDAEKRQHLALTGEGPAIL